MFLKLEKSDMDDFERRKNVGSDGKRKIFRWKPLQKCHKIFLNILLFQNILSIFLYLDKKDFHF